MKKNSMFSYWEKKAWLSDIDIAIIGAGIVGLSAAYELKKSNPGLKISIFERGKLPFGASTRNAGFACFGSLSELLDDMKTNNEEQVYQLALKRLKGLQHLRSLLGDSNINYEESGGYEIFTEKEEELFDACIKKMPSVNEALSVFGLTQTYTLVDEKIEEFGFKHVHHMVFNQHEGALDSGKMYRALENLCRNAGVDILYGFDIGEYHELSDGVDLVINQSSDKIHAKRLLICNNGFAKNLVPELDVKPARGQIILTDIIPELKFKGTFHLRKGFDYFRNLDGRVLLGGGRDLDPETEETDEIKLTKNIQEYLEKLLLETIIPDNVIDIDMRWSGIMGISETNKAPIIRKLSDHVFCAVKMGGMGVAIGSLCGSEAAEMVSESL